MSVPDVTRCDTTHPEAYDSPRDIGQHQLGVALTWARRGVPVIACSSSKKRPLQGGFAAGVPDEQIVQNFADPARTEERWTRHFKRAHVGLLTGRGATRLLVVDLDLAKNDQPAGRELLQRLADEAGEPFPDDTYRVDTPSGGLHLYFLMPDGQPIGCATGEQGDAALGPNIDVRGLGGLVIAAGSYSATQGRPYVHHGADRPAPLPEWLAHKMRTPARPARVAAPAVQRLQLDGTRAEKYADAALTGCCDDILQAPKGERTKTLWFSAVRLGELAATAPNVLTEHTVTQALENAAACAGIPDREIRRQIAAGWARGTTNGAQK